MAKTMEDLLCEYEVRENARTREAAAKKTALYAAHPVLERLDAERRMLIISELQGVLRSPENKEAIKKECALQLREIEKEIACYRKKHAIGEEETSAACPLCNGSGFQGDAFCVCLKERAYAEVFGGEDVQSLEGSFSAFREEVFPESGGQRARMSAMERFFEEYARDFPHNRQKQLLLLGTAGLGKSFLLAALLKKIRAKQRDICYIQAARLFDYFHRDRLGEVFEIGLLYNATVLAIDDLGSEPMTQNVTREYFFDLLCYRQRAGLHTFMVTNHSFSQLKERYTEKISSRLLGGKDSLAIRFLGKDIRLAEA